MAAIIYISHPLSVTRGSPPSPDLLPCHKGYNITVNNIGRAIIKKLVVKFERNEIMSIDDYDLFVCYQDLWKTKSEKRNAIRQGIICTDGCTENCIKLRMNAGNKYATNGQDKATADACGNKFIIPLDFEMIDSAAPYYGFSSRDMKQFQKVSLHLQTAIECNAQFSGEQIVNDPKNFLTAAKCVHPLLGFEF